jgi:hypothetical protein
MRKKVSLKIQTTMKTNILILAGSLVLYLGTAEAQQRDSARVRSEQQERTDQARQPRYNEQRDNATYSASDISIISSNDIPESLRQTLRQDEKYQGWENAVIYHNKKTGEYLVSPRAHRFDSEGKPIDQDARTNDRRSRDKSQPPSTSDKTSKNKSSTSDRTSAQDTASSQAMSATDQGRQQSTEGRMTQDQASEKSSQGQYGNQCGQDKRKEGASSDQPQQSDRYRTERSDSKSVNEADIPMEGMIEIQTTEVPVSLRETLNDNEYKGWELGKLYRHASTGEYLLVMDETNVGEGKQMYRFDKDGKLMKGKN